MISIALDKFRSRLTNAEILFFKSFLGNLLLFKHMYYVGINNVLMLPMGIGL